MGFTVMCLLMKCFKPNVKVSIAYMKADCGWIILTAMLMLVFKGMLWSCICVMLR